MKIDTLLDYTCWTLLIATIVLLKVAEKMLDNIINKNFIFSNTPYMDFCYQSQFYF